jgi:hypothetical protein
MITSTIATLLVLPVLYAVFGARLADHARVESSEAAAGEVTPRPGHEEPA